MIHCENLSKTYTVHKKEPGLKGSVRSLFKREKIEKKAVRGVSFHVGEGEILGLVGANGAGKTTLVKMLAGIIHPTSGTADVLGYKPWERDNRLRQQIALIMGQKASLWWDLPAADCFLLLKEIYRIEDADYQARLEELTEMLEVKDQLNIQIRRLSLGERMKMELIAALLHEPRVVFLDEPTIGLDLSAQRAIRDFLLTYRQKHRPAMILTSHYMEDIERLCERIVIVREGELIYDGGLKEVVEKHARHRIVTARLREGSGTVSIGDWPGPGTVLDANNEAIRVRVERAETAAASSQLLGQFEVADLAIEEPEIGTVIENIMRGREQA